MPEERAPFIHKDGVSSPKRDAMLTPDMAERFGRQVAALSRTGENREAIAVLQLLLQPSFYTTVSIMTGFDEAGRAFVADVALALMTAGRRRPRLMRELRQLLEKHS